MAIYECSGTASALGNDRLQCSVPWKTYTPPATSSTPVEITGELITRDSADALFTALLGLFALIFVFRSLVHLLKSF